MSLLGNMLSVTLSYIVLQRLRGMGSDGENGPSGTDARRFAYSEGICRLLSRLVVGLRFMYAASLKLWVVDFYGTVCVSERVSTRVI